MWALFKARNYEFFRDRAGFGWNILFPFLIVAGFGVIFSSDSGSDYKLGVFPVEENKMVLQELHLPDKLKTYKHIKIVPFETRDEALDKLSHHKIDILLENLGPELKYWVNDSNPKGYILEKVVKESTILEEVFGSKGIRSGISTGFFRGFSG